MHISFESQEQRPLRRYATDPGAPWSPTTRISRPAKTAMSTTTSRCAVSRFPVSGPG